MLSEQKLSELRAALEAERDELRHQLSELLVDDSGQAYDENFADSGQVAAEQGESRAIAASLQEQLDDIEHALLKFEAGTYGVCEVSGEPIPVERLEAMPATRVRVEFA